MLFFCCFFGAERRLSQQVKHINVGNNQNDLEVALYMSLSDGTAVADSLLCPLCDEPFSRWTGYNIHVTMHHETSVQNNCTQCKVRFYSRELYKQHMKRHERRAIRGKQIVHEVKRTNGETVNLFLVTNLTPSLSDLRSFRMSSTYRLLDMAYWIDRNILPMIFSNCEYAVSVLSNIVMQLSLPAFDFFIQVYA